MIQHLAALAAATVAMLTATTAGIVAQSDAVGAGQNVAPWLYGTGSVAAVCCLAYIARQFANGSIVARNTQVMANEGNEREDRLSEQLAKSHEREAQYLELLHHLVIDRQETP